MKVRATMTVETDGKSGTMKHALNLEELEEAICVIRVGLSHTEGVSNTVKLALSGWCDAINEQLDPTSEEEEEEEEEKEEEEISE